MSEGRQLDAPSLYALKVWDDYVRATPSIFRRLAFLASLRNSANGQYDHARLRPLLGADATNQFLGEQHRTTFAEWLTLNLQQQSSDFERFLASPEGYRRQILVMFTVLLPHRWYVPQNVPEYELRLFLADFEAVLVRFYAEYGVTKKASAESIPQNLKELGPAW